MPRTHIVNTKKPQTKVTKTDRFKKKSSQNNNKKHTSVSLPTAKQINQHQGFVRNESNGTWKSSTKSIAGIGGFVNSEKGKKAQTNFASQKADEKSHKNYLSNLVTNSEVNKYKSKPIDKGTRASYAMSGLNAAKEQEKEIQAKRNADATNTEKAKEYAEKKVKEEIKDIENRYKSGQIDYDAAIRSINSSVNRYGDYAQEYGERVMAAYGKSRSKISNAFESAGMAIDEGTLNFANGIVQEIGMLSAKLVPGKGGATAQGRIGRATIPYGDYRKNQIDSVKGTDYGTDVDLAVRQKVASDIIEWFQNTDIAKEAANTIATRGLMDKALIGSNKTVNDVISQTAMNIPSMVVSMIQPEVGLGLFGFSAAGLSAMNAYESGATIEEAFNYGLLSGALEAATEKIFPAVGGAYGKAISSSLWRGFIGKATKAKTYRLWTEAAEEALRNGRFANSVSGKILKGVLMGGGEATEEMIAEIVDPYLQRATFNPKADPATWEEIKEAGLMGFAVSAVLGIPVNSMSIANQIKNNLAVRSMTSSELDEWVSRQQQELERKRANGEISTKEYFEKFGSLAVTYNSVSSRKNEIKAITPKTEEKVSEAERIVEESNAEETANNLALNSEEGSEVSLITHNNGAFARNTYKVVNGKADVNSVNKTALTEQEAKAISKRYADMSDTSNAARSSGAKYGVSEEVIKAAEMVQDRTGVKVHFVDGERGMNGYEDRGEIYINKNSNNVTAQILAHEFTHLLKTNDSKQYRELVNAVKDFYGDSYVRYAEEIRSAYNKFRNKPLTESELDDEVIAHFAEQKMFTNKQSLERFTDINRSNPEKVIDAINDVIIKAAGNKEQRALVKFRKLWKQAYTDAVKSIGENNRPIGENNRPIDEIPDVAENDGEEFRYSIEQVDKLFENAKKYNETHSEVDEKTLQEALVAEKEVADLYKNLSKEMMLYIPDEESSGTPLQKNGSYGKAYDPTTVCIRSLLIEEMVGRVAKKLGRPLKNAEAIFLAQEMMTYSGESAECLYCYQANAKRGFENAMVNYLDKRNEVIKRKIDGVSDEENYRLMLGATTEKRFKDADTKTARRRFQRFLSIADPNIEYDGVSPIMFVNTEALNRNIENKDGKLSPKEVAELKDIRTYAQGAVKAHKRVYYAVYKGQILKATKEQVKKWKSEYGLRMYSFADFSPAFILENMQVVVDAAVKGLPVFAYTKEAAFVEIFAPTGMAINMSIKGIPDGKGGYVCDGMQGMDWDKAKFFRQLFPGVGTVYVATSDDEVMWAIKQDWIDCVIPFHISYGSNTMRILMGWKSYNGEQTEKKIKGEDGEWHGKKKELFPADFQNDLATYLALCEENDLKPRFDQFLKKCQEENLDMNLYMKLVNETRLAPNQMKNVQPIFNIDAARIVINKFAKTGGYKNTIGTDGFEEEVAESIAKTIKGKGELIEQFVEFRKSIRDELKKKNVPNREELEAQQNMTLDEFAKQGRDSNIRYSRDIDTSYLAAVERGDMETAQRMVDEAAKEAGYDIGRYHGTLSGGFTVFDKRKARVGGNSGAGFYFTTNKKDADQNYSDVEGADNYFKAYTLANLILEDGEYEGVEIDNYDEALAIAKKAITKKPITMNIATKTSNPYIRDYDHSTYAYDAVYDKIDTSDISRGDYDSDEEYEDAIFESKQTRYDEMIYWATRDAYSDIRNNYELINGPFTQDVFERIYDNIGFSGDLFQHILDDLYSNELSFEVGFGDNNEPVDATPEFVRSFIENLGFDSIIDREVGEKFNQLKSMEEETEHIILFRPYQAKSLDPVTYDDNGNIIPLSQRFNDDNDDIRWSRDVEGEQLELGNDHTEPFDSEAFNDTFEYDITDDNEDLIGLKKKKTVGRIVLPGNKKDSDRENRIDEQIEEWFKTEADEIPEPDGTDYSSAKLLTGSGVSENKDYARNFDAAADGDNNLRGWLQKLFVRPLERAKGKYADAVKEKTDDMYAYIVKELGIKKGSPESAAVQWYGEGEFVDNQGKKHEYTLEMLQEEFPEKWEDIVKAAEWFREQYDNYLVEINKARALIYPAPTKEAEERIKRKKEVQEDIAMRIEDYKSFVSYLEQKIDSLKESYKKAKDGTKKKEQIKRSIIYQTKRLNKRKSRIKELSAYNAKLQLQIDEIQKSIDNGNLLVNKRIVPRKDYFHHFLELSTGFENAFGLSNNSADIDPTLEGVSEYTSPKSKFSKITLHRKGGRYTPDAVGGMIRYIQIGEYMIHIDPVIAEFRKHIRGIAEATKDTRNCNKLIRWLQHWTNDLAGKTQSADRVVQDIIGREWMRKLNWLNSRAKANAVGGNINSALAQFFNIPNLLGMINPVANTKDYLSGLRDILNFIRRDETTRNLVKQSAFINERYIDDCIRRFDESVLDKPKKLATWTLTVGDRYSTVLIWFVALNHAQRTGMENPVEYADDIARRTVAGRGIGEIPLMQKTIFTKILAPFQIEVNNAWQFYKEKIKAVKNGETIRQKATALNDFAAILVGNFVMNTMTDLLIGRRVVFDPIFVFFSWLGTLLGDGEDDDKPGFVDLMKWETGELLSNMPYMSLITYYIADSSWGREEFFGDYDPTRYGVGSVAIEPLSDLVMDVANGNDILDDIKMLLFTYGTPIGGKQLSRFLDGLVDAGAIPHMEFKVSKNGNLGLSFSAERRTPGAYDSKGQLKFPIAKFNEDFSEALVAAVFGKYATKAGQKYNGRDKDNPLWKNILGFNTAEKGTPLSERATETFKKLADEGADRFEVFDVLQEIKHSKTDSEKREALMNSELTDSEMVNILMGVIVGKDENTQKKEMEKIDAVTGLGYSVTDYLNIRNIAASISKQDIDADSKVAMFVSELGASGYAAKDIKSLADTFKFFTFAPASTDKISQLIDSGLSPQTTSIITNAISNLDAPNEKSSVQPWQKVEAISKLGLSKSEEAKALKLYMGEDSYIKYKDSNISPQNYVKVMKAVGSIQPSEEGKKVTDVEKLNAIAGLNLSLTEEEQAYRNVASSDTAFAKFKSMSSYGVRAADYVAFKKALQYANDNNPDETKRNKSYDKEEIQAALSSAGISGNKAAVLFQSATSSKPENNPYNSSVAAEYKNKYDIEKARLAGLKNTETTDGAETVSANQKEKTNGQPLTTYKRVSSGYGYRKHPITGEYKMHHGIDFSADYGTPALSTCTGTVSKVTKSSVGYGNCVRVTDANGYVHLYGHLSSINVEEGDTVVIGQKVGGVGSTGASTGNHLHYEIRKPDGVTSIDPNSYEDLDGDGVLTKDTGEKYVGGGSSGSKRKTKNNNNSTKGNTQWATTGVLPTYSSSSVSGTRLAESKPTYTTSGKSSVSQGVKSTAYGSGGVLLPTARQNGAFGFASRTANRSTKRTQRTGGSFWNA